MSTCSVYDLGATSTDIARDGTANKSGDSSTDLGATGGMAGDKAAGSSIV